MFRLSRTQKAKFVDIPFDPKFYPDTYNEPEKIDMAVILVLFNPCKSVRIVQNLLLVKQYLDNANIPYYIGELSINGSPFLFKECSNIFQYKTDDYMFYKENLINLVETRIPDHYTKICTMDGDIFFDNPNWYSSLSNILDEADICQPFHTANWLNIENNAIINRQSSCVIDVNGHPGFVWAFTRSWYSKYKLPDFAIMGSGDTTFYQCLLGKVTSIKYLANAQQQYMEAMTDIPIIKYLDVSIYHLYHGSLVNRKYVTKHIDMVSLLSKYNITDFMDIIDYDENGLRSWKEPYKQVMNNFLKDFLISRKDDGA